MIAKRYKFITQIYYTVVIIFHNPHIFPVSSFNNEVNGSGFEYAQRMNEDNVSSRTD